MGYVFITGGAVRFVAADNPLSSGRANQELNGIHRRLPRLRSHAACGGSCP